MANGDGEYGGKGYLVGSCIFFVGVPNLSMSLCLWVDGFVPLVKFILPNSPNLHLSKSIMAHVVCLIKF